MQKVKLGTTQSGIKGLFTNRMLVWGFEGKYDYLNFASIQSIRIFCTNLGFELED